MTIEEKAKKLQEYCHKHNSCKNCVLNSYKCGIFASWLDRNNLISDSDIEEAYNTVFGKEDENMFTKKDLKDGMVVETRNGNRYCVCGDKFIGFEGWLNSVNFNEFLECEPLDSFEDESLSEFTIDKIYGEIFFLNDMKYEKSLRLLWKREEAKEMTVAEIEKELGYSIKIVKE